MLKDRGVVRNVLSGDVKLSHEQEGKRHRQFDSCSWEGEVKQALTQKRICTSTNTWGLSQDKIMDSYEQRKTQGVTIKQEYRVGGPQSLSQRSTGKGESERDPQLDRNTKRETRGVKREATITAGVLRPRYLRTYARPAPVNRAKGARLRLDRGQRFDGRGGEDEWGVMLMEKTARAPVEEDGCDRSWWCGEIPM